MNEMHQANMNISEYMNELLVAGGGVVTSLIAWQQGTKHVKTSHLDNVDKAIKIWEDTSVKLNIALTTVEGELSTLKQNHEDCEESKRELQQKVKALSSDVVMMKDALHNAIGTPHDKRK
jgi:hypothetical protein